jgi:predicted transcriptional regulator
MKNDKMKSYLSRRERQIMDVVYRKGEITAVEVQDQLPDSPSYSTVRALLRILVDKGHLSYTREGARYVYRPTVARDEAKESAMHHLMRTFFDNSVEQAVSTLLDLKAASLTSDELERLSELIESAKKENKS